MKEFTYDEISLMSIYTDGTRAGTIGALKEMRGYLEPNEIELLELTDSSIEKLEAITDADFAELELIPDFDEMEEEDGG